MVTNFRNPHSWIIWGCTLPSCENPEKKRQQFQKIVWKNRKNWIKNNLRTWHKMEEFESIYIHQNVFFLKTLGGAWWFSTWFSFFLPSEWRAQMDFSPSRSEDGMLRSQTWAMVSRFLKDARQVRHVWTYLPYFVGCLQMAINPQFPSQKWWHFCWMFDNLLKKWTHKYDLSYLLHPFVLS